ncbi:MAG: hypothetical protein ABIA92_02735 [Patescibacteria group bacterium]
MTRRHPRCNSDLADALSEALDFVRAFDQMVADAGGDPDRCRQRLQKDEEEGPVDPAFWEHVGNAMEEFPSLELLSEVLEGVCEDGAEDLLRSLPPDGDFYLNGVYLEEGLNVGRKDFSLCRVTYPFRMTKDDVGREVKRLEGEWKPASLLDLGAFLATPQVTVDVADALSETRIALPSGQHLFAPATVLRSRCVYVPCLKDGKLGQFPNGMDAWANDLILVWRESK